MTGIVDVSDTLGCMQLLSGRYCIDVEPLVNGFSLVMEMGLTTMYNEIDSMYNRRCDVNDVTLSHWRTCSDVRSISSGHRSAMNVS